MAETNKWLNREIWTLRMARRLNYINIFAICRSTKAGWRLILAKHVFILKWFSAKCLVKLGNHFLIEHCTLSRINKLITTTCQKGEFIRFTRYNFNLQVDPSPTHVHHRKCKWIIWSLKRFLKKWSVKRRSLDR